MPERKILQLGTPLLWEKSTAVDNVTTERIRGVIKDLDETLAWFRASTGWGRGISAPQIGERVRISVIRVDENLSREGRWLGHADAPLTPQTALVLINPEISWRSTETFTLWDDCFSFPNLMVKVSRNKEIEVNFTDASGNAKRLHAKHGLSELLQHEIDHLDGILAIDRRLDEHALATRQALEQMNLR